MAIIPNEIRNDDNEGAGKGDEDVLIISLEKAAEIFSQSLDVKDGDEEDTESDNDDEEEDYNGLSLKERVRRYHKEFGKYVDEIRKDLREMVYSQSAGDNAKAPVEARYSEGSVEGMKKAEAGKSPSERGHKWGCGCPGCTRFRESFARKEMMDFSLPDSRNTLTLPHEPVSYTAEHKEDKCEYPCGGKLRGMFQSGFLRHALSDVEKGPGLMRYIAV